MPLIERVLVEIRQRIGCANIFIQFNEPLCDGGQYLKVQLETSKLHLKHENNNDCDNSDDESNWEILFHDDFNIVANSLNNLIVDNKNISFRLSIEQKSSSTKVYRDVQQQLQQQQQQQNDNENIFKALDNTMEPMIKENEQLMYACNHCDNLLTMKHSYKRIRALPSTFIHSNEFFCHAKTNFNNLFIPNIDDLFFGYQYLLINNEIIRNHGGQNFTNILKRSDDHFYCNKCLTVIGVMMFDGKAIKLWSDTIYVQFHMENETICNNKTICEIFPTLNMFSESCKLLMRIIRDCSIGFDTNMSLIHHTLYIKAIIQTVSIKHPQQNEYLLIQIIERDLQILQQCSNASITNNNKNDRRPIKLHCAKALKIFYRIIVAHNCSNEIDCCKQQQISSHATSSSSKHMPPLLAYWQKDMNVIQMDVSPYLFKNLSNELQMNALVLPKRYRDMPDGFQTSYIIY